MTSVKAAALGELGVDRVEDTMVEMGLDGKDTKTITEATDVGKRTKAFSFDLTPKLCPLIQLPY